MHKLEADMVQPGWEVWPTTGEKLGRVTRVDGHALAVKKEGILGGEALVPRTAIRSVEERRVEVDVAADGDTPRS